MMIFSVIVTYFFKDDFVGRVSTFLSRYPYCIIVDNGSSSECLNILHTLKDNYQYLELIENSENLGIAAALNQGCKKALEKGAQWILTLDQDSVVSENMIETMLLSYDALSLEEKQRCISLFPRYEDRNLLNEKVVVSDPTNLATQMLTVEITSGNLLRRDVFEKVGYFDESLFIDYVDHDFCLRLKLAGYDLRTCNGAVLSHQLGDYRRTSFLGFHFWSSNHAPVRCYYQTRNRFEICHRYAIFFPDFVKNDRRTFLVGIIKILLGEEKRFQKLGMIIHGLWDYWFKKMGKM